ncbi:membrane-bound transcription factor site-2 protease isoform X1 [Schistocerca americana]|uniref:membrane-bound transcription factor site-2 protease n=1 Tax=Schistocerca serialis cubense TaxID=2023355 RepID=UPI001F4FD940|nr:membrane-bound transcription factor site-2 protease isoform X1 [Schistocerca americana]XP_049953095.1 membrane-bound transcription factor site-2 protease [Schistocerca serialis cubense]
MTFINVIVGVVVVHCALYFFDILFKSCSHYPYIYFLQNVGLNIEPFKIKWFTTAFNRIFQKWGTWHPKLLRCWFTVGSWVSLALVPLATYITIKTCFDFWQTASVEHDRKHSVTLEPLVPGVNLPASELGYYGLTMIACSIVHEFGHAVAAVREDVHISGCGIILIAIVPLAYVNLNSDQLESLSPKRQLRILCAGVWHNIVLAVFAAIFLWLLPLIFYPAFDSGSGVAVQNIREDSALMGPTGLKVGDRVVAINQCEVLDSETWYHCTLLAIKQPSPGYCISAELVKEHDESVPVRQLPNGAVDCCGMNSPDHLCFEYLEKEGGTLELPQHSCLPGRKVVESAALMCSKATDCTSDLHCLKPSLENSTRLVRIERLDAKVVLFLGRPAEIYHTIAVSDYVPLYFIPSTLPEMVTQICKYCILFSSGLAAVNAIPCFFLDGQYIMRALIDFLLGKKIPLKSVRQTLAVFITIIGTFFLTVNALSIVITKVYYL